MNPWYAKALVLVASVAMALLVGTRLGSEERLMLEQFGRESQNDRARTQRLIPGVW